ncbi:MAG: alpha/beta hydrolase [Lachnospiraceae bacterium]|nr:alpha/beta hydrolase [Lachnospiraceae bacterium]
MNVTLHKNNNKRRTALYIIAAVIILFAVLSFAGNYLVNYAIGRSGDGGDRNVSLEVDETAGDAERLIAENKKIQQQLNEDFLENVEEQSVYIISGDGLRLNGGYYANEGSHDWVIVIHGYRSNHTRVTHYSQRYYEEGFQVLSPDLRACGESEGDFVGMGWLDRNDILCWIDWVLEQDSEARIVLHGVSMGAATVMMTSGEETPEAVKVFVEDCGYTSVWDIFSSELKLRFGLPEFPIMYFANINAGLRAGYKFDEASALEQVSKCDKPMLFIHGTLDDFVPFEMHDILYEEKPGDNKDKIIAEGAGHGEACYLLGDEYWDKVFEFIDTYME